MIAAFPELRSFVMRKAGIVLDDAKQFVAEARLAPLARKLGATSVDALVRRIGAEGDTEVGQAIIEALTTHETLFFRDRRPFDLFSDVVLPGLIEKRAEQRCLRIWCAGCATGQEPYSIAMLLDEKARLLAGWRIEILATDISRAALATAKAAAYNQFEVQRGLPVSMLLRYFNRAGDRWRLVEHLRARVEFRELNLVAAFDAIGPFDVIFCRNVLIYFDEKTKREVVDRIAAVSRADAYLFLGASESVANESQVWQADERHAGLVVRREQRRAPVARPRLVSGG